MSGNGNGKGRKTTCPHNCRRCRAIELGLGGRGLTSDELILVAGGLVEPSREGRVQWSEETLEAQLAMDIAQLAYEHAEREYGQRLGKVAAEKRRVRRERASGGTVEFSPRYRQLQAAEEAAKGELREAQERLRQANRLYYELNDRDSRAHRAAQMREAREQQEAERKTARAAERSAGRKLLHALTGGGE
jgi:hypothetical protein